MKEYEILQLIAGGTGIAALSMGLSVGIVASCKVFSDCIENARLAKRENKGLGTIFPLPILQDIEVKKLDKSGIKKEASVVINEFVRTLTNEGIDISNLYRNFRAHSVEEVSCGVGKFDGENNILIVNKDNLRKSLLRALLESTVTYRDTFPHFVASGFERTNYRTDGFDRKKVIEHFGVGLNEAYKNIFLARYFDISQDSNKSCEFLMELAMMIEDMVGIDMMEECFFKGDLATFIYRTRINYRKMENWILKMDRVYYSWTKEMESVCPKLDVLRRLGATSYRSLFVDISKEYIDYIFFINKAGGSVAKANWMVNNLNTKLDYRSRHYLPKTYGITESDIDTIKQYGDAKLSGLRSPYIMTIRKPERFDYH